MWYTEIRPISRHRKEMADMARVSHKIGFEEKGQRTARSTDVYLPKGGSKEPALCRKCGAIYRDKRWSIDEEEAKTLKDEGTAVVLTCPACQRMADNNPAGIVTFSGDYLLEHWNDILNIVQRVEAVSRSKNPLGRIMEINQEESILTIATTEDKLAQKLGREVYKAHKGELHYQWSHDEHFVRVSWTR
jgi:NMD protein affecting ribosome stability and mRNA decay